VILNVVHVYLDLLMAPVVLFKIAKDLSESTSANFSLASMSHYSWGIEIRIESLPAMYCPCLALASKKAYQREDLTPDFSIAQRRSRVLLYLAI